jgi:DNA-binding NtrC family response regulator
MDKKRILVVDDEKSMCEYLEIALDREGYAVDTAQSGKEALKLFRENEYDAMIADIKMPELDGVSLLRKVRETNPAIPVVFITAYASMETAIESVRLGASDYVTKPFRFIQIKSRLKQLLEAKPVLERRAGFRPKEKELIGKSKIFIDVLKLVGKIAKTDSTILVAGESGTGKELIAREIHLKSPRKGEFVSINCGALPETLLESELFGHKKGSFTDAYKDKDGLFKVANGGSLFLDEISETSPAIQVKLLRVLQEKEVVPIGGTKPIKVDVRLIASTNQDLRELVKKGRFREDLYFRINVIPVRVPPLRERKSDIKILVDHFLKMYCKRFNLSLKKISPEALKILSGYDWPGNIRELENVIERAVVLSEKKEIGPDDLPMLASSPSIAPKKSIKAAEIGRIMEVLEETNWNKSKAAKILGIHLSTLYRKMEAYGVKKEG